MEGKVGVFFFRFFIFNSYQHFFIIISYFSTERSIMSDITNTIYSASPGTSAYDNTMKNLLANKQFLARILKRFVREYRDASLEDIMDRYIEPDSISISRTRVERNMTNAENIDGISNEDKTMNEGNVYFDIIFKAVYPDHAGVSIGMYINIEIQNSYYPGYAIESRGVYYAARRLSSQLRSLADPKVYNDLQKVYSIWLCIGDVPNYAAGTASLYRMIKDDIIGHIERDPKIYDLMNVIVIRINDKVACTDDVLRLLQTLCSNNLKADEKIEKLTSYGIEVNDKISEEVNTMCNLGEYVLEKGMKEGMKRGIEQGKSEGKMEQAREIAIKLNKRDFSVSEIAEIVNVSAGLVKEWLSDSLSAVK